MARVNSDFALHPSTPSGDGTAVEPPWGLISEDVAGRRSRLAARLTARWGRAPLGWQSATIALLGAAAATGVGYLTARNPAAAPAGIAVEVRVLIIGGYIAAGIYAQTSRIQAPMAALLIASGLFSSLWLLNGSSNPVAFTVGVACASVVPAMVAYVMLAHPTGRVTEKRFLWAAGGTLALFWLLANAISLAPALNSPLLACDPKCPVDALSWPAGSGLVPILVGLGVVSWIALTVGTPILLARRARTASAPVRQSIVPVWIVAVAIAVLLVIYLVVLVILPAAAPTFGAIYVGADIAVPLAVLAGLSRERLFMGQALAELVDQLARLPQADPEALIAAALRDPSLRIAYCRPESGTYMDSAGRPIDELPADRAVTWIERNRRPVAAVMFNPELSGLERFVRASASAALIRLEKAQLEADLKASTSELAASRGRLVETAHAERRRLERDLHDGVQQHLVGIRIKLDLAAERIRENPGQGEQVLASVGRQLDDVLQAVRSLARGIYPSLLSDRGLVEALRAAGRSAPRPIAVRSRSVGRYAEEVEVAVYFCCLEALQNISKHAGRDAAASITLSEEGPFLRFEVSDSGVGFNPRSVAEGAGMVNMRDRIEAVEGRLEVLSRQGRGTIIRGFVPLGAA